MSQFPPEIVAGPPRIVAETPRDLLPTRAEKFCGTTAKISGLPEEESAFIF